MGGKDDSINDSFVYAFIIIALFFGVQYLYEHNTAICNNAVMVVNKGLLYPFSFLPDSNAEKIVTGFHWKDPLRYNWGQMVALTAEMGKYWRWVFAPLILYMTWSAFVRSSIHTRYQRSFTMRSLIKNNIKAFPCMAPVANRDILKMPLHEGAWRLVLSPLQFAVAHDLIVDGSGSVVNKALLLNKVTRMANGASPLLAKRGIDGIHLDKTKAIAVLSKQVGPEFKGINALPDHLKGLAAAFIAYGLGKKEDGQKMLDHMSLSYKDDDKGNALSVDITGAATLITKYASDELVIIATQFHTAYTSTWLSALLVFARKKGVLACSQFIWLRPMDRGMFYALNQVDCKRPWSEAIGPWVHFTYEKMAKQPIYETIMDDAANDLAAEIAGLGFIDEKTLVKRH